MGWNNQDPTSEGGQAPDIVLEGPERLVANWGARGLMADLSDLWTVEAKEAIYDSVESACQNNDGVFYEYPLCMTAHTMAINKDIFEQAGALQYIDEETRTWTAEDFQKAVKAVYDFGQENVGAVYCSGQGGDQGTRALVNNLFGGTFTNPDVFVIGGGVSRAGEYLTEGIRRYYQQYAFHASAETPFVLASLGNDAGMTGAAGMVCNF